MEDLIKFVSSAAIITVGVAWVIRSLVAHLLSKDIDSYRNKLQTQANIELEKTKHELSIISLEFEKQNQILQECRAKSISELYGRLVEFIFAAGDFSNIVEWSGDKTKEEKAVILSEKAQLFTDYFNKNKIYFSKDLCEKVRTVFDGIYDKALTYRIWMAMQKDGVGDAKKYHESWENAWNYMKDQVPALREMIEDEFRVLLGVK